jgi:hypothetical protein
MANIRKVKTFEDVLTELRKHGYMRKDLNA